MNKWKNKPRYHDDPAWYKKRNKELLKDKENGMGIAELCGKYLITPNRIYSVIKSSEKGKDGTR